MEGKNCFNFCVKIVFSIIIVYVSLILINFLIRVMFCGLFLGGCILFFSKKTPKLKYLQQN